MYQHVAFCNLLHLHSGLHLVVFETFKSCEKLSSLVHSTHPKCVTTPNHRLCVKAPSRCNPQLHLRPLIVMLVQCQQLCWTIEQWLCILQILNPYNLTKCASMVGFSYLLCSAGECSHGAQLAIISVFPHNGSAPPLLHLFRPPSINLCSLANVALMYYPSRIPACFFESLKPTARWLLAINQLPPLPSSGTSRIWCPP